MCDQIPDTIWYNGAGWNLTKAPSLPKRHPRIVETSEKERRAFDPILRSTACWRQYVGSWLIVDDKLYLTALTGRYRLDGTDVLFADWFSGVLHTSTINRFEYDPATFSSGCNEGFCVTIDRGKVLRAEIIDNSNP